MAKNGHSRATARTVQAAATTAGRSSRTSMRSGPGRPTAARVKTIDRAILVAARAEFMKAGYEPTRMEVIAVAAGVSKGTLYGRYPTKEALLRAVISDQVATWSENWEPDDRPVPLELRQRLKHRAHRLMQYCCSDRIEQLERLISGGPPLYDLRRVRHEAGHQLTVQVMAQDILDGSGDSSMKPRTAMRAAEMLLAMIYGWWRMRREIRPVQLKEAISYADHAVDVLFEGQSAWAK